MPKRSFGELLTGFGRVRAAWLDNAVTTMRLDDRYATAWLVGSLAWGEEDVLSDIDMVAIFADDSASIVLADPNREFERFGHLLLDDDRGVWTRRQGGMRSVPRQALSRKSVGSAQKPTSAPTTEGGGWQYRAGATAAVIWRNR